MTRYEQGFMRKCAEYGVDGRGLLKSAALSKEDFEELRRLKGLTTINVDVNYEEYLKKRRLIKVLLPLLMASHGAVTGGLSTGSLSGAGIGAGIGGATGLGLAGLSLGLANMAEKNHLERNRAGKPASWWAV